MKENKPDFNFHLPQADCEPNQSILRNSNLYFRYDWLSADEIQTLLLQQRQLEVDCWTRTRANV